MQLRIKGREACLTSVHCLFTSVITYLSLQVALIDLIGCTLPWCLSCLTTRSDELCSYNKLEELMTS